MGMVLRVYYFYIVYFYIFPIGGVLGIVDCLPKRGQATVGVLSPYPECDWNHQSDCSPSLPSFVYTCVNGNHTRCQYFGGSVLDGV